MALKAMLVLLMVGASANSAHAQDMGGADLTGEASSKGGDADIPPEVEAVSSPAPLPLATEDLTVGSPAQQPYGVWDRLAACEASGNWHSASNPIYKGGLQFDAATWTRHGGLKFAWRADFATRDEQIVVGKRTQAAQGWGAWPVCSRRLGLR